MLPLNPQSARSIHRAWFCSRRLRDANRPPDRSKYLTQVPYPHGVAPTPEPRGKSQDPRLSHRRCMVCSKISSALSATKMRGAPVGTISESALSMRRCNVAPGGPIVRAITSGAELVFAGRLTKADQARPARSLAQSCPVARHFPAIRWAVKAYRESVAEETKSPKGALATGKCCPRPL
jgi:hypothetical protein